MQGVSAPSQLRIRKGTTGEWCTWVNAGKIFPELATEGLVEAVPLPVPKAPPQPSTHTGRTNVPRDQFWILTCRGCGRTFILGVNAAAACWEEIHTLGKGAAAREDVVGKLRGTGAESDLIGDTRAYQAIPETLSESDLIAHKHSANLLWRAIAAGQPRRWNCNHCKHKNNEYPPLPLSNEKTAAAYRPPPEPNRIQTGNKYPVAFLLFECSACPGNYLNHARSAVLTHFSGFDPTITGQRKVLSGDLLPSAVVNLRNLIADPSFGVNLQRLDAPIAACLRSGNWPGDIYVVGILFVVERGVDLLHDSLKAANVTGYCGLFTVPVVAGSSDILDLTQVLSLMEAPIGERA